MGAENVNPMLLPFSQMILNILYRLVRPFRDLSRRLRFWWPLPLVNKHEAIPGAPGGLPARTPLLYFLAWLRTLN